MKTLLITGGAGFIGSNFVRYMRTHYPHYRIIVLDALTYAGHLSNLDRLQGSNSHLVFCHGNVCNPKLVDQLVSLSDVVVHFAAESHVTRSLFDNRIFFETDVIGTQTVANAIVRHQDRVERFIHISTSEVYGTAEQEPMTEEHPLNPTNPYAAAKAGADRLVYSYWRTYHIPAVIVRPFNNYGPRQHLEKVVPQFITRALSNEPLTVHGTGEAARDWVHVHDHCRALDRLLHHDIKALQGQVINIGTGVAINVRTIAELVLEFTGRPYSLIQYTPDRPGQVAKHIGAFERAQQLLAWAPTTAFEDGLRQTVRWYAENRSWWEPLRWMVQLPGLAKDHSFEMPAAPPTWMQAESAGPQRLNGSDGGHALYEPSNGKAPH